MMVLNTHPENRKDMVKAISELISVPAVYQYTPSYAFQIGPVTVNRDGTVECEDEEVIQTIRPMLVERGWLEAEEEAETSVKLESIPENVSCLTAAQMSISMPVENWTVSQLTNLLRIVCSKQDLINRMLDCSILYVEESFVKAISENPPETAADFEARVMNAVAGECIRGLCIEDSKVTLSVPFTEDEPTRWTACADLLKGILKTAETAVRVALKRQYDSENEKYHANSWLMRMGFGGPEYKETRRILMGHLNGFAAFKSADDMEAHKERQAQRRRERCEEAQE